MHLCLYFNSDKFPDESKILNKKLDRLKKELLCERRVPEHEKDYKKYSIIKETSKAASRFPISWTRSMLQEKVVTSLL